MNNEIEQLKKLQDGIGYTFFCIDWLREALRHPSLNSADDIRNSNQRLEFLGDSVLGSVLACWLFQKFPSDMEGDLSKKRSLLAKGSHLTKIAKGINLGLYVKAAKSEKDQMGQYRDSLLEDALEALIGAVFMDGGYDRARKVILNWKPIFEETLMEAMQSFNPKGRLQEFLQTLDKNCRIRYKLVSSCGPDHHKTFEIEVLYNEAPLGIGKGRNKREAEERAAESALLKVMNNHDSVSDLS